MSASRRRYPMRKDLKVFLYLEVASTLLALAVFRFIAERWIAGLIAASGFVLVGTYMVIKSIRWKNKLSYPTFYMARVELWVFTLPMLLVRLRFMGREFSELQFFGMPAPIYHQW